MKNKTFNFDKFHRVINKDISTLLLVLISSDFLISPLFFVCPIILCLILLFNRLNKMVWLKTKQATHFLEVCVIFISYIFLLPFLMLMLSFVCEDELLYPFMDDEYWNHKNVISTLLSKRDRWFDKLHSFLLNDYFASKYFLKW